MMFAMPAMFHRHAHELVEMSRAGTLAPRLAALKVPALFVAGVPDGICAESRALLDRARRALGRHRAGRPLGLSRSDAAVRRRGDRLHSGCVTGPGRRLGSLAGCGGGGSGAVAAVSARWWRCGGRRFRRGAAAEPGRLRRGARRLRGPAAPSRRSAPTSSSAARSCAASIRPCMRNSRMMRTAFCASSGLDCRARD